MRYYAKYFFAFILAVATMLAIRNWIDRKIEKALDIEIVRKDMDEGDTHLGFWEQKNDTALIQLRLKRNGQFFCKRIGLKSKDTIQYAGQYQFINGAGNYQGVYPRMLAISNSGDTVINHFVKMSRATEKNIDVLELKKQNYPDASAILFYRIEQ